jgi:hypothetical protein
LNRAALADFGTAAANAIAAGKVSGFTPDQALEISTAILNKAQSLAAANGRAVVSLSQYHTDTADAQGEQLDMINLLSAGKFAMRGVNATPDQYAAVGFTPPSGPSAVTPETPTDLSAAGQSNSVTKLRFKGNNIPGSVAYILEATRGVEVGWFIIGTTGKQSFKHEDVVPGQGYQYRVRAQAASGKTSEWSNTAAVYDIASKRAGRRTELEER